MLLRRTIEKHLPLQEGESRLSSEESRRVFKGFYMFAGKIQEVKQVKYYGPESNPGYVATVTRLVGGEEFMSGTAGLPKTYSCPHGPLEDSINQPSKLQRANRVERIGTQLKVAAAVLSSVAIFSAVEMGNIYHRPDPITPAEVR